jgi:pimeloyl-ACP methyl ester carboxylesterase
VTRCDGGLRARGLRVNRWRDCRLSQLRSERDNIELAVVNAGHVPHDDAPEAVNAAVTAWLGKMFP